MSELSELFDKDPLQRTKKDRRKIIEKYREDRVRFLSGQKVSKAKSSSTPLNLDDLDI